MPATILFVEDNRDLRKNAALVLELEGYQVQVARDGREALDLLEGGLVPDLIVSDIMMPRMDGYEFFEAVRRLPHLTAVPFIFLTARGSRRDISTGRMMGADDYLVKPFDLDELAARIRALLRRSAGRAEAVIEHLGVRIEPATRTVSRNGAPVTLSPREYAVLEALLLRPGAVLSRAQLEDRLYGWDDAVGSNAVEVYIHGLRRKLGRDFIRNLRGVGWFVPAATPETPE